MSIQPDQPATDLTVRLQPRARREAIIGERDGVLQIAVSAPPLDGQANEALCRLIAKRARIARSRVHVVKGRRSRVKVVRIDGIGSEHVRRALGLNEP